jgi:predicted nucleic acid-binding protein
MRLLGSMQPFEVTEQVAWPAATLIQQYRRSHSGIGLGEYLIAATARPLSEQGLVREDRPYAITFADGGAMNA